MINKYDLAIQRKKEIVAKYGGKNLSEKLNISSQELRISNKDMVNETEQDLFRRVKIFHHFDLFYFFEILLVQYL